MRNENVRRLARLAVLSALAIVLALGIHFPIMPAAPWLEYDPADIPILIGTFLYGPWWGLLMTVVVSVIQGTTVSAASGWIGIVMHILSTGAFCVVAGLIYRRNKTIKTAIIALVSGALVLTVVMTGCNMVFMPLFLGRQLQEVIDLLVPVVIPFNLIKAAINSTVTFLVYKSVGRLFGFIDDRRASSQARS